MLVRNSPPMTRSKSNAGKGAPGAAERRVSRRKSGQAPEILVKLFPDDEPAQSESESESDAEATPSVRAVRARKQVNDTASPTDVQLRADPPALAASDDRRAGRRAPTETATGPRKPAKSKRSTTTTGTKRAHPSSDAELDDAGSQPTAASRKKRKKVTPTMDAAAATHPVSTTQTVQAPPSAAKARVHTADIRQQLSRAAITGIQDEIARRQAATLLQYSGGPFPGGPFMPPPPLHSSQRVATSDDQPAAGNLDEPILDAQGRPIAIDPMLFGSTGRPSSAASTGSIRAEGDAAGCTPKDVPRAHDSALRAQGDAGLRAQDNQVLAVEDGPAQLAENDAAMRAQDDVMLSVQNDVARAVEDDPAHPAQNNDAAPPGPDMADSNEDGPAKIGTRTYTGGVRGQYDLRFGLELKKSDYKVSQEGCSKARTKLFDAMAKKAFAMNHAQESYIIAVALPVYKSRGNVYAYCSPLVERDCPQLMDTVAYQLAKQTKDKRAQADSNIIDEQRRELRKKDAIIEAYKAVHGELPPQPSSSSNATGAAPPDQTDEEDDNDSDY